MKIIYLFSSLFLMPAFLLAQYTTPNDGTKYSLNDLVDISEGAVTVGNTGIHINEALTIAEMDTLEINTVGTVLIAEGALITIEGGFTVTALNSFKPIIVGAYYPGFRFESSSAIHLENSTFRYGGGLRALTGNLTMINCTIRDQTGESSSGGALGLSTGKPIITSCTFYENERPAIGSGATNTVAPVITECVFIGNNTENDNRPQINLGPSGIDTTFIIDNDITGYPDHTMVGGIGVSVLVSGGGNAVISQNTVRDNRYGIAAIGSMNTLISNNYIKDNNTQGDPFLGGSGININAASDNSHVILNNEIRSNLWGITVQGTGMINMGDLEDESIGSGGNIFSENGNNGAIFALFNNTPNAVMAQGNCWIEGAESNADEVEGVISHMVDDEELGLVDFSEFLCAEDPVGVYEVEINEVAHIYPNPTQGNLSIELSKTADNIRLFDLSGRLVETIDLSSNNSANSIIRLNLSSYPAGIYLIQVSGKEFVSTGKIILQ